MIKVLICFKNLHSLRKQIFTDIIISYTKYTFKNRFKIFVVCNSQNMGADIIDIICN